MLVVYGLYLHISPLEAFLSGGSVCAVLFMNYNSGSQNITLPYDFVSILYELCCLFHSARLLKGKNYVGADRRRFRQSL